ncbi:MAG: hypothetical protein JSU83_14140, partial [Deltaproteobacteria bacterium]
VLFSLLVLGLSLIEIVLEAVLKPCFLDWLHNSYGIFQNFARDRMVVSCRNKHLAKILCFDSESIITGFH